MTDNLLFKYTDFRHFAIQMKLSAIQLGQLPAVLAHTTTQTWTVGTGQIYDTLTVIGLFPAILAKKNKITPKENMSIHYLVWRPLRKNRQLHRKRRTFT